MGYRGCVGIILLGSHTDGGGSEVLDSVPELFVAAFASANEILKGLID